MKIETERLVIRTLETSDYPEFERTLNDVQKSCCGSGEGFLNWIISQYPAMDIINGLISLGIFEKQTGKFLGTVGAGQHDDLHETEIFYHLLPESQGHGYATEAAKAVTEWALKNYDIPYIIGTAGVENTASQRVLERCGYALIDTRTLLVHVTGERYDFKYYRFYRTQNQA